MTDAERLIERLLARDRDFGRRSDEMPALNNPDGPEAATLIRQQAARIVELEGALRPFAEASKRVHQFAAGAIPPEDIGIWSTVDKDGKETRITVADLNKARAVLGETSSTEGRG